MSNLSPALQARLDAIRAKTKTAVAAAASKPTQPQAKPIPTPVPTPVPAPQSHVIKPSLVTVEGAGEYEPFKLKLAELEQQLDDEVKDFSLTLRDLHRTMSQDPNVVTVLSPEEISIIVKGLARHMDNTVIVAKKTSSKKTQPIVVDDL